MRAPGRPPGCCGRARGASTMSSCATTWKAPLGGRPIVRVRPSEIQAWVASRSAILAPGTLRNYLGMLRSVFAAAALDGVIARNPVLPAGRLSLPRRERPKIMPLTVAQVQAWADAAPPRIRNMIVAQGCPRPADQRTAGAAAGRCGLPTARGPGGGPAGPGWPTPSATQVSERGPDRAAAHRGLRSAGRPYRPVPTSARWYGLHHRSRTALERRRDAETRIQCRSGGGRPAGGHVQPRPAPSLRLGAAGRWGVGPRGG